MDPLSTVLLIFQGLNGVANLYSFVRKLRRSSSSNKNSKHDLTTPLTHSDALQMQYAYLFHMVAQQQQSHSPYGFSPFVTGYPAGFVPPYAMATPSFHQQAHFYQQPQIRPNLFTEHFPTVSRMLSSASSSRSVHESQDSSRSAGFQPASCPPQPPSSPQGFSGPVTTIQVIKEQEARNTFKDDGIGMSTGGHPEYTDEYAKAHWRLFTRSGHGVSAQNATIAVLDWTGSLITMYVRSGSMYYRNYRVRQVDVGSFATTFQHNEVCSGIIRNQQLEAINKHITLSSDPMSYRFRSSNCWTFLGLPCPKDELDELGPAFLEAPRGAVFGIINCLYTAPHRLNVDMKRLAPNLDAIHVDCVGVENALGRNPASDCAFTVFEFATNGWAHEQTLIG